MHTYHLLSRQPSRIISKSSSLIWTALCGAIGFSTIYTNSAQAYTLPQGAMNFGTTSAYASSKELWYYVGEDQITVPLKGTESEGHFNDSNTAVKFSYGITDSIEIVAGVDWSYKSHRLKDDTMAKRYGGVGYYTLGAKVSALQIETLDATLYGTIEIPNDPDHDWIFTSPNDSSYHYKGGVTLSYSPVGWLSFFADNSFIYRTSDPFFRGENTYRYRIDSSAGVSFPFPVIENLSGSAYFHNLYTQDGTNCFHSVRSLTQFHELPYGGTLSDKHWGFGGALSYSIAPGVLGEGATSIEAFTYTKVAGINTDKSTSIGVSVNYTLF